MFGVFTKSRANGRPIEIYKFAYGDRGSDTYLFTDADFPVTRAVIPAETYQPVPISRASTNNSGTLDRSSLEITVARNNPVPEMFRIYPPNHVVTLTIFQGEAEDPDAEFKALWSGRVLACAWDGSEAKLACEPISTALNRVGLRRNFQYMCPHILYGPQCKKVKVPTAGVVSAISGKTVKINSALADPSHYNGGMLEWTTPEGLYGARTIVSTTVASGQTTFTLNGLARGLLVGASVDCVKGCSHTVGFCRVVHGNVLNFGGQPWIPLKNPISNVSPFS